VTADGAYVFFCAFAGLFGLLFGSFLNVCIARMPEDRSIAWPGSACPKCGTPIKPYDNVPVLAWFWLGGKCRACKATISGLYPTVEALFGVLAVLIFRRVVPDLGDLDTAHVLAVGWYGWLVFALLGATFIDLRHLIIPDSFSIYLIPIAVGGCALLGHLGYHGAPTWQQSVVGALVGGGFLGLVSGAAYLWYRYEAMGWGDVKLLALLGAWFGAIPAVPVILMIAAVTGSVVGVTLAIVRRKGLKMGIPFGPYLALGGLLWFFFGNQLAVTIFPGVLGKL
jgi:leader peptidase (prepilin peptidase)/N-methyltransferase